MLSMGVPKRPQARPSGGTADSAGEQTTATATTTAKAGNTNSDSDPVPEKMPPCRKCGRSDSFVVGVHDYAEEIANRLAEEKAKFEKETAAADVIQRAYRVYLLRMYGSAYSKALLAERQLQYKAVTAINAQARGRLARRRIVVERHLRNIKVAHPLLLKYALKNTNVKKNKGRRVFWYQRSEELTLLYHNYIKLCERTGFSPPRKVVEENIIEISRRITFRKTELVTKIQKVNNIP
jgi:hypothetical protein